jgi:hypothetical protein
VKVGDPHSFAERGRQNQGRKIDAEWRERGPMGEEMDLEWQRRSEQIKEWRLSYPKATLHEIEAE